MAIKEVNRKVQQKKKGDLVGDSYRRSGQESKVVAIFFWGGRGRVIRELTCPTKPSSAQSSAMRKGYVIVPRRVYKPLLLG